MQRIKENEETEIYSKWKNEITSHKKGLNKIVISNLPDKEFKIMVAVMLTELRRRMDEQSENFNKEIENIRKY